jgi:hypothetical protein
MLWTIHRGRAVGAVRADGGICFIEGAVDGSDNHKTVHLADEQLAGSPVEAVCLATVVDASIAGASALLLLRSAAAGGARYVLMELFDASHCLQPTLVLSFTVSEEEDADMQDTDSMLPPRQRAVDAQPWIIDGPVVCIPRTASLVVAHLAMVSRRGEVASAGTSHPVMPSAECFVCA